MLDGTNTGDIWEKVTFKGNTEGCVCLVDKDVSGRHKYAQLKFKGPWILIFFKKHNLLNNHHLLVKNRNFK